MLRMFVVLPRRINQLPRINHIRCINYLARQQQPLLRRWNCNGYYQQQQPLATYSELYAIPSTNRNAGDYLHRCVSSSSIEESNDKQGEQTQKIKVCYLDLRGFGISILERLVMEECILKHDPEQRHWIICGTHTATPHKYLQIPPHSDANRFLHTSSDGDFHLLESTPTRNDTVSIVMGIGGKPKELLNIENVQKDHVSVMKRFTGGGTVVIDHNSIWTTIIGRPLGLGNHNKSMVYHPQQPSHHPRPIMEYTANTIYQPIFQQLALLQEQKESTMSNPRNKTLILDSKSCGFDNSGRVLTMPLNRSQSDPARDTLSSSASYTFALRENDYVLYHNTTEDIYKMGGNAQAITKDGFLHHTSFLWDYDTHNMEEYLLLPKNRPQYRHDRNHTNFLISLQAIYPSLQKQHFFTAMSDTCHDIFDVQRMSFIDVMKTIINAQGGIQSWYETQSRTKIIHDL
jgi:lipoate-protein ligase A